MTIKLKKGDRVRHAKKPEWGVGEVLADPNAGSVRIFFQDAGPKEFVVAQAPLVMLETNENGSADYLSELVNYHLKECGKATSGKHAATKKPAAFVSFGTVVQNFLSWFPNGFMDPKYLDGKRSERQYKERAHQLMVELLDETLFASLIEEGSFHEVCIRAKRVISATNLISPHEIIPLSDALKDPAHQEQFARSLFELLYGGDPEQVRFDQFAVVLADIGAAKWPIATYFPFLRFPDREMFLKPEVTQAAANVLHFDLNYKPGLNWLTYSCVLELANKLQAKLEQDGRPELRPRDLIDVQSFIWVTAPGYY